MCVDRLTLSATRPRCESWLAKLVILLLCASHFSVCESTNTYFVVPTIDSVCPNEESHCMTLSEFSEISNGNFSSEAEPDLTFVLLPGNHILDSNFKITNVSSSVIIGNGTDHGDETIVSCMDGVVFEFKDIEVLRLSGISFSGCVFIITSVNVYSLDECELQGDGVSGSRLELFEVNSAMIHNSCFVMNSQVTPDIFGGVVFTNNSNTSIYGSLFDSNYANYAGSSLYALNSYVEITDTTFSNNTSVFHGGAIEIDEESEIVINNCTFSENRIERSEIGGIYVRLGGGGISVLGGSSITVNDSLFVRNSANDSITSGGAICAAPKSTITISNSEFIENLAGNSGGALAVNECEVTIVNTRIMNTTSAALVESTSHSDYASTGGAVASSFSNIEIDNCEFINNVALKNAGGGAIGYAFGSVTVTNSLFVNNEAFLSGGAIGTVQFGVCTIFNCTFIGNKVKDGVAGAISCGDCTFTLGNSTFRNNGASKDQAGSGGALTIYCSFDSAKNCGGTISDCLFTGNSAFFGGSAIALHSAIVLMNSTNTFTNNTGVASTVFYATDSSVVFNGNTTFSDNFGSIFAYNSNMTFSGSLSISNASSVAIAGLRIGAGGALSCYSGYIALNGETVFSDNISPNGAGILALQCIVEVKGELNVTNNVARVSGGGIYVFRSIITFAGVANILSNRAQENGGGIYAVNSLLSLSKGTLSLIENSATHNGGGIYFETNSKLHITKTSPECLELDLCFVDGDDLLSVQFIGNSADYGGAICVDDAQTLYICMAQQTQSAIGTECFFQTLALYPTFTIRTEVVESFYSQLNLLNVQFLNNSAREAGHSIYGGLLDRCGVNPSAEVNLASSFAQPMYTDAVQYLMVTTNIDVRDVSSDPVRVCFCLNNQPDCSYKLPTKVVRKGERFTVPLVAVDHVNNTVPSRIRSSPNSPATLQQGQRLQPSNTVCSELNYNVITPVGVTSASIDVFAAGPCQSEGISRSTIDIQFLSCPIGFIESADGCECDPVLVNIGVIAGNCSIDTQSVVRRGDTWISFQNSSNQEEYLVSRNCPLDYCLSSSNSEELLINLNVPNGADVQCAFNRSGILCGQCADGLSLLLGSSHCGECSNHNGLALIIVFAIAGVLLVIFILVCNLTIAVGTINGLIFYANIVSTNSASFFPQDFNAPQNILAIFIAWLNLDFGFETCFFNGMDEYAKTWLQLAFPSYIIFLVILIIIVSQYSSRFSKLIANKNPVATLATLVLLSYTKFLRLIIDGASFATIGHYRIGQESNDATSVDLVWRIDGSVAYFEAKHLPLFILVLLIGLIGFFFVFLLLFWQCLQRCPNKHPFKILSNTKLKSYMDAHFAPFKDRHRYWIGIQLVIRIVLYGIIASNDNSATSNLLSICLAVGLLFMLNNVASGGVYKNWLLNILENVHLFNLLFYALATIYAEDFGDNTSNPVSLAFSYISLSVAFITFLVILMYHTCLFVFRKQIALLYNFTREKFQIPRKKHSLRKPPSPIHESLLNKGPTSTVVDSLYFQELRNTLRDLIAIDPGADTELMPIQRPDVPRSHSTIDGVPFVESEQL